MLGICCHTCSLNSYTYKLTRSYQFWFISGIFKEYILSIFWPILDSNYICGHGGEEVVREAPEENLWDFMTDSSVEISV